MSRSHDRFQNKETEFKLVTYKRGSRRLPPLEDISQSPVGPTDLPPFSHTELSKQIRRLEDAKAEVVSSDFYCSALASIREGLTALQGPPIFEVVCLGLGRVSESLISRYQLAFLLSLRDIFNVEVSVFDPNFSNNDHAVLTASECKVLGQNLFGKHKAQAPTIFYLPHCPVPLVNNLLWANWGPRLSHCVIISNSFYDVTQSIRYYKTIDLLELLSNITPHSLELAVINTFKYNEVFNNTAVHVFPLEKLRYLPDDFWTAFKEPSNDIDGYLQSYV